MHAYIHASVCLRMWMSYALSICPYASLSIRISLYLCLCPSARPSAYLSLSLSISLPLILTPNLSIRVSVKVLLNTALSCCVLCHPSSPVLLTPLRRSQCLHGSFPWPREHSWSTVNDNALQIALESEWRDVCSVVRHRLHPNDVLWRGRVMYLEQKESDRVNDDDGFADPALWRETARRRESSAELGQVFCTHWNEWSSWIGGVEMICWIYSYLLFSHSDVRLDRHTHKQTARQTDKHI